MPGCAPFRPAAYRSLTKPKSPTSDRREALLREYGEVTNNFRSLTDIRFRLLALLPLVALITLVFKDDRVTVSNWALSFFGLVFTLALVTYHARNDQLYDELVGRAAMIERELGLPDGCFANRLLPWRYVDLGLGRWKIDHATGVNLLYAATIALWLFGTLTPAAALIPFETILPGLTANEHLAAIQATGLMAAILVTFAGLRLIGRQDKQQSRRMRALARKAVGRALQLGRALAVDDQGVRQLCADLRGGKAGDSRLVAARARFIVSLGAREAQAYLGAGTDSAQAAQLVAFLTDLPPRWLLDCVTDRTGALARDKLYRTEEDDIRAPGRP